MDKALQIVDEVVNIDLMKNPVNWVSVLMIVTVGAVAVDLVRRIAFHKGDENNGR